MRSTTPAATAAAAESPPPTITVAPRSAVEAAARATSNVPDWNGASSKTAHRPAPYYGAGTTYNVGEKFRRTWPDISDVFVLPHFVAGGHARGNVGRDAGCRKHVHRQQKLVSSQIHQQACCIDPVFFHERVAYGATMRLEKGVGHGPHR